METLKSFQPGEIIFKQDEPGDALFVIKEGSVEIFKDTPEGEVVLTMQHPGEIIGMLSFFNSGKRLASARARTAVEGQMIERKAGQDPLAPLPKWVQTVLKEFTLRLEQINNQYAGALKENAQLKDKAFDKVFFSVQIASAIVESARFFAKKMDDGREVAFLEPLIDHLEKSFNYERKLIQQIIDIFKNTAMIKIELEPDHNKEVMALSNVARLKWYADFVRSAKSGKNRKVLNANIPFKFRKILFGLREFVQKSQGDVQKLNKIDLEHLVADFEKLTRVKLEEAALGAGAQIGLLDLQKSGEKTFIIVNPASLVRTLIAINVVKRLRTDPTVGSDDETELAS